MMMSGRSSSRCPFTAAQWQELQHQALIFKYMASGIPIPSDLIIPLRRSFLLESFPPSHPPLMGWGWQEMGYGGRGKGEDPEPGRCRRTDGKKWRCSKEAYPDSKYCERHMHRGKNRSRKPVEVCLSSTTTTPYPPPSPPLSISTPSYADASKPHFNTLPCSNSYYPLERDYNWYGNRERDVGAEREGFLQFRPLEEARRSSFELGLGRKEQQQQKQHCFVLGADLKMEKQGKGERREEEEEAQRPLRHFFPQKGKDEDQDKHCTSNTLLSIRYPNDE